MSIIEPKFRCGGNWQELANLFGYEIHQNDQDWTYTIVEHERIDEYINAYDTVITNEDTKFSLMEMIIQSFDDQPTDKIEEKWLLIKKLLIKDFELNKYTIYYWCDWECEELSDAFFITPIMRNFWIEQQKLA